MKFGSLTLSIFPKQGSTNSNDSSKNTTTNNINIDNTTINDNRNNDDKISTYNNDNDTTNTNNNNDTTYKKVYCFCFLLAGQITDVSLLPHISRIGNTNREWR